MKGIYVTKATDSESNIVADLVIELLKDFNQRSGSNFEVDRKKIVKVTKDLINRSNYAAFIAFADKIPVGLLTISQASAIYNGGDFGVITELYVDRESRSKGIGKLLLESAYAFAKMKDWKRVEVGAPHKEEWPRTLEFYKNSGFKEKGPKLRIEI